jgi:hypothetical protein
VLLSFSDALKTGRLARRAGTSWFDAARLLSLVPL